MSAAPASHSLMSIGEVLTQLRGDFPDVTISKIRFLESEGLVEPARTPSGYRKFSHADVGRLHYVLATQRDHYLPLRVEQALALEEADLRDRDVGELVLQEVEDLADGEVRALGHESDPPCRNTSLNLPIWSSSPWASGASSMRSRLR